MIKNVDIEQELVEIVKKIKTTETRDDISFLAALLLNLLMKKEREISLREQEDNKANGYYERELNSALGKLNILVPRDRKNNFRPFVLPEPWKKGEESFNNFILNLIMQSYSPNKIKSLLSSMHLPYSPEEIEEIKEELYSKAKEMRTKELPENSLALIIDAYRTEIKDEETNKVKKAVIYTIIGIDLKGVKSVYGYYIFFGQETRDDWISILNDLIGRGLKRVMIIISDDFSGLISAIKALFPNTDHQLCVVHMMRNVKRNMTREDAKIFNNEIKQIKLLNDYEKAIIRFEELCRGYEKKYSSFIKGLIDKKEHYWRFLKYPEVLRKHFYTTNIVENFNSRLEVLRVNSGGYFQSIKTAEIGIYVMVNKLQKSKWRKPMVEIQGTEYEIMQMFNRKFFTQTQF